MKRTFFSFFLNIQKAQLGPGLSTRVKQRIHSPSQIHHQICHLPTIKVSPQRQEALHTWTKQTAQPSQRLRLQGSLFFLPKREGYPDHSNITRQDTTIIAIVICCTIHHLRLSPSIHPSIHLSSHSNSPKSPHYRQRTSLRVKRVGFIRLSPSAAR